MLKRKYIQSGILPGVQAKQVALMMFEYRAQDGGATAMQKSYRRYVIQRFKVKRKQK
jgi:hypothetical protein